MKTITLTLTEDEFYAVGWTLQKFKSDYRLRKEASAKAKNFDKNLTSANEKIWEKIGETAWSEENMLHNIIKEEEE